MRVEALRGRRGLLALAMLGAAMVFAPAALALNPQPLPPGMRRAPMRGSGAGTIMMMRRRRRVFWGRRRH